MADDQHSYTTARVEFLSNGVKIAGLLYTPKGHESGDKLSGIVIGHPGGGVKEQAPTTYAKRLVEYGFAALVFDAAYQGESDGQPRGLEDPYQRAEDVRSAVSYLTTRPDIINAERIAALGICASGGYVSYAAQTDSRIKAVGTVSAFDMGEMIRSGMDGKQTLEALKNTLAYTSSLRTAAANGAEPTYHDIVPPSQEQGGEAYDYYFRRAKHPRSNNKQLTLSLDRLAQFRAFSDLKWISPRPVLMIAGSEAHSKPASEAAIASLEENKELFIVEGATHMSLYDQDDHVTPAVKKLSDFYSRVLTA